MHTISNGNSQLTPSIDSAITTLFVKMFVAHNISSSQYHTISVECSHQALCHSSFQGHKAIFIGGVQVADPFVHTRALTGFLKGRLAEFSLLRFK